MSNKISADEIFEYNGSTFHEVKRVTFSGKYEGKLPYYPVAGLKTLLQLLNDSRRNMSDRRDIRPYFNKLIHPNGISYTGKWRIDQKTPYTGYFATGAEGLLIARASVAGPRITRNARRALGIAGKVYPTLNPDEKVQPGNFVTVSKLSGVKTAHITDIEMFNMPTIGWDPAANFINRILFRTMDTRPQLRQLFPISTLGMARDAEIVTPDLLMLKVADGTPKVDADDFRDELRLERYPDHTLIYNIHVKGFDAPTWQRIGSLEFNEYALSEGGDKRIHFWIPRDVPARN